MIPDYKVVKKIEDVPELVHCAVCSPPYFQQRKYGDDNTNEIGREKTVTEYVDALIAHFNKIPLHSRGSLWVNIGDKRVGGGLTCAPELFATTMLTANWVLVDKVVWAKIEDKDDGSTEGNCMTEPAERRLNGNGHEFFYRFVRKASANKAWADPCAVAIPRQEADSEKRDTRYLPKELMSVETSVEGRNLHNFWRVTMGQTRKKHYAVYPLALCERPIAMTCPMRVCRQCGDFETRIVEKQVYDEGRGSKRVFGKYTAIEEDNEEQVREVGGRMDLGKQYIPQKPVTMGWTNCQCGKNDWTAGIVMDPFAGSGTTGEVALKLGRSFVGVEIYDNYIDMIHKRCQDTITFLKDNNLDPWLLRK